MAKRYMYFGSWGAHEHPGCGQGIYYASVDLNTGEMAYLGANRDVPDCGIICMSPDLRNIYAVNELSRYPTLDEDGLGGAITALRIRPEDGYPETINRVPSLGSMPNNLCIDPLGAFVLATNHGTFGVSTTYRRRGDGRYALRRVYDRTSLVMLPVTQGGAIGEACHLEYFGERGSAHSYEHDYERIQYGYRGICPVSPFHLQGSAHLHSAAINGEGLIVVCNRGADRIYLYEIDREKQVIERRYTFRCKLGIGPRHVVFHPNLPYFYVVNELESSTMVFRIDSVQKRFRLIQRISTLPEGPNVDNMPSDIKIHPTGNSLYCSNRHQNTLCVYCVDPETGELRQRQTIKLPGKGPRGFGISPEGTVLVVGLADDCKAVSYQIASDGTLGDPADMMGVPTPTSVIFGSMQ